MHSLSHQHLARELTADRLRHARAGEQAAATRHPPSRVRWRAASLVARLAWRLDADAARVVLK